MSDRGPIRVLVVDDSAMMRELLTQLLQGHPNIQVVGTASDGRFVPARLRSLQPDVMTLDLEMPGVGGLDVLRGVMSESPLPVVVVSASTGSPATSAMQALATGAVSCIGKPEVTAGGDLDAYAAQLRARVQEAAHARPGNAAHRSLRPAHHAGASRPASATHVSGPAGCSTRTSAATVSSLIAIGASTGGTVALERILTRMPPHAPPIIMTQHISARFSQALARRLDTLSPVRVTEARNGDPLHAGCAYLAPGDAHLCLQRQVGGYICQLSDEAPRHRHRPSVDVMFMSAAKVAGASVVGVLLTGMGRDGARGMHEIRQRGGWTIAQDEASSVVWGMPKAAIEAGGACEVLSLGDIRARLSDLSAGPSLRPRGARAGRR